MRSAKPRSTGHTRDGVEQIGYGGLIDVGLVAAVVGGWGGTNNLKQEQNQNERGQTPSSCHRLIFLLSQEVMSRCLVQFLIDTMFWFKVQKK